MENLNRQFFDGEVLVCGCHIKDNLYYKRLYKAFTKNGIKVYPMPTEPKSELGFTTYENLEDLPKIPNCAYILSHKSETHKILGPLFELGIKKIVFFSKACADDSILELCASKGIEIRLGCPLMLFAGGFCWLHSVFAGVKR